MLKLFAGPLSVAIMEQLPLQVVMRAKALIWPCRELNTDIEAEFCLTAAILDEFKTYWKREILRMSDFFAHGHFLPPVPAEYYDMVDRLNPFSVLSMRRPASHPQSGDQPFHLSYEADIARARRHVIWEMYMFRAAALPVHAALVRQREHMPQGLDTMLVGTKRMVMFMQRLNRAAWSLYLMDYLDVQLSLYSMSITFLRPCISFYTMEPATHGLVLSHSNEQARRHWCNRSPRHVD